MLTYPYLANISLGSHTFFELILVAYKANSSNFDYLGGILGLSFPETAVNQNPGFIQTLLNQKIIEHAMFGVKLNFKKPNSSFITFGQADHSLLAPNTQIIYYPIIQDQNQFKLSLHGLLVGEYALSIYEALLDTGNTCISIPHIFTD